MTEKDFESYVWVFWSIAGLGIFIYGLAYAPLLMLLIAAMAFCAYWLLGGR